MVALDAHRDAYRYHRLFRDLLRDELDEHEPGAAAEIGARAAAWCAENGERERAVEYAHASGDMDLVARLVLAYTFPMHWSGRIATVGRWLDWFDREGERERRAALAVIAGWVQAMEGRTREARRWLTSAEQSADAGPMPDGASKAAWVAVLRGYMAPAGMEALASDARIALAGIPDGEPIPSGDVDPRGVRGDRRRDTGSRRRALCRGCRVVRRRDRRSRASPSALGERAIIALGRGDVAAASRHVEAGLALVREAGMEEFVTTMTLHAAAARVALGERLAVGGASRDRPREPHATARDGGPSDPVAADAI